MKHPAILLASILAAASLGGALAAAPTAAPIRAPAATDWRVPDPDNVLVIDTSQGRIFVELTPEVAPASVARVKALARQHLYDGLTFFRVIDDFMDQTGDPKNTGEGGSALPDLKAEFTFRRAPTTPFVTVAHGAGSEIGFIGALATQSKPIGLAALTADGKVPAFGLFCTGVIGMARATAPDTANSQFFLMRHDHPPLNANYTAFGRVIVGETVVRAIKTGEPPTPPMDTMIRVRVLADMPAASRPTVRVIDPRSPYFADLVAKAKTAAGDDFNPCDVEVPAEAK